MTFINKNLGKSIQTIVLRNKLKMINKAKKIWKDLLVTEKPIKAVIRRLNLKSNFKINHYLKTFKRS